MCPWPSFSTCSASSPCARLSRAPSTIGGSDFHNGVGLPMDGPFSRPTRSLTDQDRRGSPRFHDASFSVRAVLSDPAGVSSSLAFRGSLLVPSKFSTLSASGCKSNEAQSLHLRYGLDVARPTLSPCRYLHEPKVRFQVGPLIPGREFHPLEAPGLAWRTEKFLQIKVHDEPIAFGDVLLCLFHRLMR